MLRSAEVKPLFYRFVQLMLDSSSLSLPPSDFRAGPVGLVFWFEDATGESRESRGYAGGECLLYLATAGLQARLQGMTYILFPVLYDHDEE